MLLLEFLENKLNNATKWTKNWLRLNLTPNPICWTSLGISINVLSNLEFSIKISDFKNVNQYQGIKTTLTPLQTFGICFFRILCGLWHSQIIFLYILNQNKTHLREKHAETNSKFRFQNRVILINVPITI